MSDTTKIQWAHATFNPWIGCTKISPGCANCYAATRMWAKHWGKGVPRRRTTEHTWQQPLRWNVGSGHWEHARVFPSLCDWLDPEVPIEWLADFLKLIYDTPDIDWLLLTKRPELWKERLATALTCVLSHRPATDENYSVLKWVASWLNGTAPNNVWIGASAEDQKRYRERVPALIKIPARIRFLSLEPLLEDISISNWGSPEEGERLIHWIIVGGESGSKARPCDGEWIRGIVHQCHAAGTAVFVKQLGSNPVQSECDGVVRGRRYNHPKGGDPAEWPTDLRVRKFPNP